MFSKFLKKNKNFLDSRNKNDLLHNVYILYAVFTIAVLDIFYILQIGDFSSATIFVAVGLLVSLISKNMIVILCIAMTVTHIFKFGEYNFSRRKEGFETDVEEETDELIVEESETNEPIVEESVSGENALNVENEEFLNEEYKEEFEPYEEESDEESDFHLEKEKNKKDKKEMSENKVKELIEKQNVILDKLNTMKPFLSTMKNWFGGSESKNTESNQ